MAYSDLLNRKIEVDRMGFEPMASCLQSRRSSTDLPALPNHVGKDRCNSVIVNILFDRRGFECLIYPSMSIVGGDPSAGSPTDTLLRLSPAH